MMVPTMAASSGGSFAASGAMTHQLLPPSDGSRRTNFSRRSQKPVISKLETFLKRTLPLGDFVKVRTYEACIIRAEDGTPLSKYAIVTNDGIFITDNPHPKVLTQAVDLGSVVSVGLVNDYPDFVCGQDREKIQHVCVSYLTAKKDGGRSKKQDRSSLSELRTSSPESADDRPAAAATSSTSSSREDLSLTLSRIEASYSPDQQQQQVARRKSGSVPSLDTLDVLGASLVLTSAPEDGAGGSLSRAPSRRDRSKRRRPAGAASTPATAVGPSTVRDDGARARAGRSTSGATSKGKGDPATVSVHSHCDSGFLEEESTIPSITTTSPAEDPVQPSNVREGHEYDSFEDGQSLSSDGSSSTSTCSGSVLSSSIARRPAPADHDRQATRHRQQPQPRGTRHDVTADVGLLSTGSNPAAAASIVSKNSSSSLSSFSNAHLPGSRAIDKRSVSGRLSPSPSSTTSYWGGGYPGMKPSFSHQHLTTDDEYRSWSPDSMVSPSLARSEGKPMDNNFNNNRAFLIRTLSMPRCDSAMDSTSASSRSANRRTTSVSLRYPRRSESIDSLDHLNTRQPMRHSFVNVVDSSALRRDVIQEEEPKAALGQFHVYILSQDSNFPQWIRMAWTTHLIVSTTSLDPTSTPNKRRFSIQSREKLEMLLQDLKEDLIGLDGPLDTASPPNEPVAEDGSPPSGLENDGQSCTSCSVIVQIYSLIQELNVAAKKSIELRQLFWKDQQFFPFLLNIAEACSKGQRASVFPLNTSYFENSSVKTSVERQEELELLMLTLDTLATLMQGASNKSEHAQVLLSEVTLDGPGWLKLLDIIMNKPSLPFDKSRGNLGSIYDSEEDEFGEEFCRTLADLMDSKIAVLFEILKTLSLNFLQPLSSVLHNYLNQPRANAAQWIERFITRLAALMWPEVTSKRLSPKEAVLVYKYLFALHHFLLASANLREHLKQNCRNVIQLITHERWLPLKVCESYPIKTLIREELRAVTKIGIHLSS